MYPDSFANEYLVSDCDRNQIKAVCLLKTGGHQLIDRHDKTFKWFAIEVFEEWLDVFVSRCVMVVRAYESE